MATAVAIRNLIPLFIGLALIALAAGSQGSLLAVRSTIEGFGDVITGALSAADYSPRWPSTFFWRTQRFGVGDYINTLGGYRPHRVDVYALSYRLCLFQYLCGVGELA